MKLALFSVSYAGLWGQAALSLEDFLRKTNSLGYDGWVAYEMCSPLRGGGDIENLDACATKFIEYMKQPW